MDINELNINTMSSASEEQSNTSTAEAASAVNESKNLIETAVNPTEAPKKPTQQELMSHIEAVLFSAAKPVPFALLCELFEVDEDTMKVALEAFEEAMIQQGRGLRLKMSGIGYELVSAPESSEYVSKIRQKEDRLSAAAMETLAIVAFKQPVTKSEIEEIRGVNCEKVLKQLVGRDLIAELGRKETIGRPVLYGTTDTFLRSVGIESVDNLKEELGTV